MIAAEVLLVSRKRPSDIARWVTLDIGKFSGLAETADEAIRYQIETIADGLGGTTLGRPYASGSFTVADDGTARHIKIIAGKETCQ